VHEFGADCAPGRRNGHRLAAGRHRGFILVSGLAAIFAVPQMGSADGGLVMSLVTAPDSSVLGMFFRHLIPFAVYKAS
jgi:hypothetical protein